MRTPAVRQYADTTVSMGQVLYLLSSLSDLPGGTARRNEGGPHECGVPPALRPDPTSNSK